ncbi:XdhC family protein [Neobacillus pocheonensis]|uniref:XdhC family protein n=1 Tax=Neobacillus pocheonensis TaxID=363869 RepID=UPI003D29171B
MEGIHEILNSLNTAAEGDVLATIIRVEGSAYRKAGTSMLVRKNGLQVGMISAGCLEEDLAYRVEETRNQQISQTIVYDMRDEDDLSWGQGAGCNGVISILLEPVDACLYSHLRKLKFLLESGKRVTVVKKLTLDYSVVEYLFVTDHQHFFGKWQGILPSNLKNLLSEVHQNPPKSGISFFPEVTADLYIHSFEPKPRLIVFGAGRDAVPLVKLASQTGFSVLVSDWRPGLCKQELFPDATQILVGVPNEVIPKLQLSSSDSVIVTTHHFQRDKEILKLLQNKKLRFLGVIGSKLRTERLLEGNGIPPEISSPVGISIGAEGPEEIAVSIVAELIQKQRIKKLEKVKSIEG